MPVTLNGMRPAYQKWLKGYKVTRTEEAARVASFILRNKERYEGFSVPWWFVGALHYRECGGDFSKHLANGDPISAPTVNEPVGIPAGTWRECAIAALARFNWDNDNWGDPILWLWRAEQYNGFGYAQRDKPSPYLWAGTNVYVKGYFVADGKWDENAINQQVGIIAVWKMLGLFAEENLKEEKPMEKTTPVATEKQPEPISDTKKLQQLLIAIGQLDRGQDDGAIGNITRSAIRAAQRMAGVEPNDKAAPVDIIKQIEGLPKINSDRLRIMAGDEKPETALAVRCAIRMRDLNSHLVISNGSDNPQYNIAHTEGITPDGKKNEDKIDYWNDSRVWFTITIKDGNAVILGDACAATTEAGWHYRQSPMDAKGCAQIELDKQFYAWRFGLHGSKRYKALVQCRPITVFRDANKDGSRAGDKSYTGDFAINIHHGWNAPKVGVHSAGCQVARSVASHERFMRALYGDRRARENPGNIFANITLDGSKL